jgi:hypothetical protein
MISSAGTEAWQRLEPLIAQRDYNRLTLAVEDLTEAERAAIMPVVTAWTRNRYGVGGSYADAPAAAIIGAGALNEAAKLTTWLSRNHMWHHRTVERPDGLGSRHIPASVVANVYYLLTTRDLPWLSELVDRLADALPKEADFGRDRFELMERLAAHTGHPLPVSDGTAACWADIKGPETAVAELTGEPRATDLIVRFFNVDQVLSSIDRDSRWPVAIGMMIDRGDVRRSDVLDAVITRLGRGGKTGGDRAALAVLKVLAVQPAEVADRVQAVLDMVNCKTSTVAEYARMALCRLADTGQLDASAYAELVSRALRREEKKIVRAQLTHLAKTARTPAEITSVSQVAVRAVEASAIDLQRETLRAVARLARAAPGVDGPAILDAAAGRPADLVAELATALGTAPVARADPPPAEVITAPSRVRLEPVRDLHKLAELVFRVFEDWVHDPDIATLERATDGLLWFGVVDPSGLRKALAPTLLLYQFTNHADRTDDQPDWGSQLLLAEVFPLFIAAVIGRPANRPLGQDRLVGLDGALVHRFRALAAGVRADGARTPISRPTWTNGLLAPEDLLERVADPRAASWDVEVEQALLRLDLPDDPGARSRLADRFNAVETWAAAGRAAQWIRRGGPALPLIQSLPVPQSHHDGSGVHIDDGAVLLASISPAEPFAPAGALWAILTATGVGTIRNDYWTEGCARCWAAIAPRHRELLLAHCGQALVNGQERTNGVFAALPSLAGINGSFGSASALAFGYALGTKRADQRAPSVEALRTLLARGEVDAVALGSTIAELILRRAVPAKRVRLALGDIAATDGSPLLWPVVARLLPPLLVDAKVAGLADLLGLAAELVERTGARDMPDGLGEFASRRGSTRALVEARRLAALLGR